jgi:VIT1/CCC1 family predicted Fe2+/Mn2+ transporter
VLGVTLGVAAASVDTRIVLVAGLATTFSEAISMAAVAYTSRVASGELFRAERAREYRHIEVVPEIEVDEIRSIYARKGFHGDLLERIVKTITADRDVWVAVMMAEEHGLADVDRRSSLRSAITVGLASFVGSLLPLAPFVFLPRELAPVAAIAIAVGALGAFGAYKARVTVGRPWKGAVELAAIGTLAAMAGYLVGLLAPSAP